LNIFVTGTDTDVGKTTVSAWICMHTQANYRKLIQTGNDSDASAVKKLSPHTRILPEVYRLSAPLSPYDAAVLENTEIDLAAFDDVGKAENTVFEGSGGALVPIAENFFMADLIKKCGAAALIVAASRSGMISHTLMTAEVLKARGINLLGIIINGQTERNLVSAIEKFSRLKVLAIIPRGNNLAETLRNTPIPPEILETVK
jgi:dethiobiotin synthase